MVAGARFSNFSTWRLQETTHTLPILPIKKARGRPLLFPPLAAPHREFDPTFGEFVLVFDGVTIGGNG